MRTPLAHVLPLAALMPQSLKQGNASKGKTQSEGNQQNRSADNRAGNCSHPTYGRGKHRSDALKKSGHRVSLSKTFFQKIYISHGKNAVEIEVM